MKFYLKIRWAFFSPYIANDFFGGESGLLETKKRDKKKAKLCENNGIKLIYYNYNEKIEILDKRLNTRP